MLFRDFSLGVYALIGLGLMLLLSTPFVPLYRMVFDYIEMSMLIWRIFCINDSEPNIIVITEKLI